MITRVISAFPCCGKTFATNHSRRFEILDSDSSKFSWILNEDGTSTGVRNPAFPDNYIEHVKENLGKYDIIFVSSHTAVREALILAQIPFIIVYPQANLKVEWIGRMYLRGDSPEFISRIYERWEEMMDEIDDCACSGDRIFRLNSGEYINPEVLYTW